MIHRSGISMPATMAIGLASIFDGLVSLLSLGLLLGRLRDRASLKVIQRARKRAGA